MGRICVQYTYGEVRLVDKTLCLHWPYLKHYLSTFNQRCCCCCSSNMLAHTHMYRMNESKRPWSWSRDRKQVNAARSWLVIPSPPGLVPLDIKQARNGYCSARENGPVRRALAQHTYSYYGTCTLTRDIYYYYLFKKYKLLKFSIS